MKQNELAILLSINEAIVTIQNKQNLFKIIFERLSGVLHFQFAGIILLDISKTRVEAFMKGLYAPGEFLDLTSGVNQMPLSEYPFSVSIKTPQITRTNMEEVVVPAKMARPEGMKEFMRLNVVSEIIHAPLLKGGEIIGFLNLGFAEKNTIKNKDFDFLQKIADQVAISVSINTAFDQLVQKEYYKNTQLRVNNSLASEKERDQLFIKIATEVNKIFPCSYVGLNVKISSPEERITVCFTKNKHGEMVVFPVNRNRDLPLLTLRSQIKPELEKKYHEYSPEEFAVLCRQSAHFQILHDKHGVDTIFFTSFSTLEEFEINLILAKGNNEQFYESEIQFILQMMPQFTLVLNNYFAYEEINHLKKQLEQEKNYLLEEINLPENFQEVIGNTAQMQQLLYKVQQVAPLDVTVLIQGETGTGKELIARAIHNLSDRKDKALVKVNCAALPATLIESELFGHEKGSFTGAIETRIGKFELANGGTIFLDEIGEMPLEIQSKLLRVLQENEFERVGGKKTLQTNVRIVAATNRILEDEVANGKFRADLFFRLNVFPLQVPPLRQRLEDIPLFVKYFLEKYSKKLGKNVLSIKKADLETLMQYNWPGNVRELEHLIERAIIISTGNNLEMSNLVLSNTKVGEINPASIKPLVEIEREHIITALRATGGKVTGENGAAAILGINGKTLGSKMRKLGIKREILIK
jgi:transcriptional regulator with GAF, ATPase, and Fis domain